MKDLSKKLDPYTLNAPRTLVGGLAMLTLTLATGRNEGYALVRPEQLFFMLASVGVGGGLGDACYVLSMARIGVSRAFPIANTYPTLTMLFGMLFLGEHVSLLMVVGLVAVLGGILLMSRRSALDVTLSDHHNSRGIALALVASVCWAVSMVLLAPGLRGLDNIMVASIRTPALALFCWGMVATRRTWPKLRALAPREWVVLIVGGLIGWGLGSVLFLTSVSMLGATRAAILTSTSPLFALPLSVTFLKEKVNRLIVSGTALTVVGIILVS
jgi:DME family drug/metabolite transporter